jgi:hypothetical protein
MSASDVWVYSRGNKLIRREENDGWTYLNRGPEANEQEIIGIGGFYQVIVVGGKKLPIQYCGDWETIVAHFTKES